MTLLKVDISISSKTPLKSDAQQKTRLNSPSSLLELLSVVHRALEESSENILYIHYSMTAVESTGCLKNRGLFLFA